MKRFIIYASFFLVGAFFITGCEKKDEVVTLPKMSDYLKSNTEISLFAQLLDKAMLTDFVNGPGPFTWFAPTNAAFTAAGITTDSINRMTSGTASYVAMYHLVNAQVGTVDMIAQNSFPRTTQQGGAIYLGKNGNNYFVNGVSIISPDVKLQNGTIHIINRVLVAPQFRGNLQSMLNSTGQHSIFIAALTRAGRWAGLATTSVFTVFAPNDAAMTAAGFSVTSVTAAPINSVDSLVRYHYISNIRLFSNDLGDKQTPQTALGPGRTLTSSSNGTQIKGKNNPAPIGFSFTDRLGTNGVLHNINGVLRY
jgi:uncharacterized surface protein with fasciclin (FAS1) repeats